MKEKHKTKNYFKKTRGITLIALVVTIIVLLILAGISISMLTGNNGILNRAAEAKEKNSIAQLKEQLELEILGSLENENLNALKVRENVLKNIHGTTIEEKSFPLTVTYSGTQDSIMINRDGSVEINNNKYAIFDTGMAVAEKMWILASDGIYMYDGNPTSNMSINAIKQYNGNLTQEELIEKHAVDVSYTAGYEMYEQNPDNFENIVPKNSELCPIYMWFEKEENKELRSAVGTESLLGTEREVDVGTIYFWSESKRIYLNKNSSNMFARLPYLKDISGLKCLKAEYVENMSNILYVTCWGKTHFTNLDDLDNWDVSNVINLSCAFMGNPLLTNVNGLKNWNVEKVQNMSSLFEDCCKLTDISGLANWNTSNVEDMSKVFGMMDQYRMSLKDINVLKNWDVHKVKSMWHMFFYCSIEDATPINDWDITSVEANGFWGMFGGEQSHPEFTKRNGTWDEDGTFNPY